jgi:hypothetical protein
MSDISDVLLVLAKTCAAIIYPALTYDQINANWDQPKFWEGSGPSIVNSGVRIYPGWPTESNLDDDLVNGISHLTIFTQATERNTTRYPEREHTTVAATAPSLSLALSGPSLHPTDEIFDTPGIVYDASGETYDQPVEVELIAITIRGTVTTPQNIALRINGKFYVYAVQQGDTLASIAAALGALVVVDIPGTTVTGAALTLGPRARLQAARIGTVGTIAKEVRRQERVVMITVWANAPDVRDTIASAIDVELAQRRFITMPNGFGARLIYKNSMVIDSLQKATLYRRDLNYTVEYATTVSKSRAQVIAPSITFNEELAITF